MTDMHSSFLYIAKSEKGEPGRRGDVFIDYYSLSSCYEAVLFVSNVFYAAGMFDSKMKHRPICSLAFSCSGSSRR